MIDYKKLQNGSDIRGVAIEIPGGKSVDLTEESVQNIGSAFALFAAERLAKKAGEIRIAIGRDSRLSGAQLTEWLISGITYAGAAAFDAGMASTPAMFMCCVNELHFDAGIMVTASHLPMERNGMKFFLGAPEGSDEAIGGLEKADISAILKSAEEGGFIPAEKPGVSGKTDVMTPYIEGLKEKILAGIGADPAEKPFAGMRIVVDAGNGAGGFFATRLLATLGADITGSRYLEPDGNFPNHQPNPENAAAMASICEAVTEANAQLGIIFDTDVDRAGAVLPSENGAIPLDRNRLIALMTAILVREYGPITAVTDSITSTGLAAFIENLGCRHHRFKRGYRNVINEAKRLMAEGENAIFAMETSGHGALAENYFLDDGAYIIVKILIEFVRAYRRGETLNSLIAALAEPAESSEVRMAVNTEAFADYTAEVLEKVKAYFENCEGFTVVSPNYEGVRVGADAAHGDGWFLIRRSLHDPLMPTNLESNSEGGVKLLAAALMGALADFDKLETAGLAALAE
ncbi:MAG: phosphomannomutase/phosphoglucomutase [Clostridia bacterium]|nr:phosphomannomutase/phosphoglucomutase [Clostridia bacterium]